MADIKTDWQEGMKRFYSQDYSGAIQYMENALRDNPDPEALKFLEFVRFTKQAAAELIPFENERFILWVHPSDKVLSNYAFDALDAAYETIGPALGYFPDKKITVEIYPASESFNIASSLSKRDMETSGAVGICKFNKIMMISPRCLAFGFRWLDTLCHEYTHYAIAGVTGNNCPLWLHEGISRYCDTIWRTGDIEHSLYLTPQSRNILADNKERLISFSAMEPSLVKLETQEDVALAFAQVSTAVDLIGLPAIKKILSELGKGKSVNESFVNVLGKSVSEFEKENSSYIIHANFEKTSGAALDSTKLKSPGADEISEFVPLSVKNYILLGDRFLKNGFYSACEKEYLKAETYEPNNPVVLNKLGKLLISKGDVQSAEMKFRQAILSNPNYLPCYIHLADILFSRGSYSEAAEMYEQAYHINPFHPGIHQNLAECYDSLKMPEKAKREYTVVRELFF